MAIASFSYFINSGFSSINFAYVPVGSTLLFDLCLAWLAEDAILEPRN